MIGVKLPSGRVVQIDTDDPKAAAAAARKFVAGDSYESARANSKGLGGQIGAGLQTALRAIPGASELEAAVPTLMGRGGNDFSSAWKNNRAAQQGWVDEFKSEHPVLSNLTTGLANAAPIAAAIATGGASEIPAVAAPAEKGIAGLLKPVGGRMLRRATVGAGAGAVVGASQPGSVSERLSAANRGGATGAAVGTVLPAVADLANLGGKVASATTSAVSRAANKVTGGALLDPVETATSRLTSALKADGATPDALKAALNGFLKNGATDPTLIDVASRLPSGGQNTLALVRGAATKGSGRGVAVHYADQVTADLQDKAIAATKRLTPDQRPAAVVRDSAVEARDAEAEKQYGAIRNNPVDAAPVLPALEGNAGRQALSGAYKGADARRMPEQMAELDRLRAAAGPETVDPVSIAGSELPMTDSLAAKVKAAMGAPDETVPVSLGTLHRTKVALEEAGRSAAKADANSVAGGLFSRAEEIDNHLAKNPDYAAARDNYARRSAGIEAIDHGATGLTAAPDDFAAGLEDLKAKAADPAVAEEVNPAAAGAQVGYRQALTDAIGAPTEGATGALNRVSTATNQKRNLEAAFDPETAQAYRDGLADLTHQLRNARFVNPNTGSATAGRLADLGLVEPSDIAMPHTTIPRILLGVVNKIRNGATLTDEERGLIARMGTTPAKLDEVNLADHMKLPPSAMLDDMRSYIAGVGSTNQRRDRSQ